ncbi:hypothetical protein BC332_06914 [Capsicum chinense]|nr:hypothetical protein BC332_06914 [Capsicum chinense]
MSKEYRQLAKFISKVRHRTSVPEAKKGDQEQEWKKYAHREKDRIRRPEATSIRGRSLALAPNLLLLAATNRVLIDSLTLATKMFQFAKFEMYKERRLATELGYDFLIGDPWITDSISPWNSILIKKVSPSLKDTEEGSTSIDVRQVLTTSRWLCCPSNALFQGSSSG